MDSDNVVFGEGFAVSRQNGVQEQHTGSEEDSYALNGLNETDGISVEFPDEIVKGGNQPRQSKTLKTKVKVKTEKALRPKSVSAEGMKKNEDVKEMDASTSIPNGQDVPNAGPKQPPKLSEKSATAFSEDLVEKTKLKPLKKGTYTKAEGETQSSPSSTSGDAKARKAGALPSYGFSFKCSERAEKRREFYTKLEEMTQAKEEEKNSIQAKTKESQQAEIKMLRKSLNFKATPMPSFYQEPPPPKVELKKTPITRAKSPKLGRKKTKDIGDTEGNLLVRLSLDERVSKNNAPTEVSPIHSKQPSRNSLPAKLPSAKKVQSKTTTEQKKPSLKTNHAEKPTSLNTTNEGKTSRNAVDENANSHKAENGAIEEQAHPDLLPEPATAVATHLST